MHRALRIPEILDETVGYLPRSSLPLAARVSTDWMESALDHLWKTVDGLEPLLELLAPLSWDNNAQNASFLSSPSPKSLARFRAVYAHRIRCMEIADDRNYALVWQVMVDLVTTPSFLPRLRSLEWDGPLDGVEIFWTPTLHEIELRYRYSSYPSLLRLLNRHIMSGVHLLLWRLSCEDDSWDSDDMEPEAVIDAAVRASLASLIRVSTNLQDISFSSRHISTSLLLSLASLRYLRQLCILPGDEGDFDLSTDLHCAVAISGSVECSSLSSISLGTLSLQILTMLVSLFKNSPVETWHFSADEMDLPVSDINAALGLVCGQFKVSELIVDSIVVDEDVELIHFNPLYLCQSSLMHLVVALDRKDGLQRAFRLSDEDMLCFAQNLPRLRSLVLWTSSSALFSEEPSDLTVASLIYLARYCPEIEKIMLHWNASFKSLTHLPSVTHRFGCLKRLVMRHLRIDDPKLVASFLAEICVNRVDTDLEHEGVEGLSQLLENHYQKYNQQWCDMDIWYRMLCILAGSGREQERLEPGSNPVLSGGPTTVFGTWGRRLVHWAGLG